MATSRTHDPDLAVWPALLVSPSLVLAHLSAAFALVTPLCGCQKEALLHPLSAASLAISLVLTLVAWGAWRRTVGSADLPGRGVTASESVEPRARASFLALVGTLVGAFSTLVLAAMWLPVAVLPACN